LVERCWMIGKFQLVVSVLKESTSKATNIRQLKAEADHSTSTSNK